MRASESRAWSDVIIVIIVVVFVCVLQSALALFGGRVQGPLLRGHLSAPVPAADQFRLRAPGQH